MGVLHFENWLLLTLSLPDQKYWWTSGKCVDLQIYTLAMQNLINGIL